METVVLVTHCTSKCIICCPDKAKPASSRGQNGSLTHLIGSPGSILHALPSRNTRAAMRRAALTLLC